VGPTKAKGRLRGEKASPPGRANQRGCYLLFSKVEDSKVGEGGKKEVHGKVCAQSKKQSKQCESGEGMRHISTGNA